MTKLIDADKLREQLEKRLDKLYDNLPDSDVVVEGKETNKEAHTLGQYVAIESIIYDIDEAPDLSPIDSKELDEAAEKYATAKDAYGQSIIDAPLLFAFKAGANWQAQHSLTWEDIRTILSIGSDYAVELSQKGIKIKDMNVQDTYEEVLKRFNTKE